MKATIEQAREYLKSVGYKGIATRTPIPEHMTDFANSLNPLDVKVDDKGEIMICPTSRQRGQSEEGFKRDVDNYNQSQTIKQRLQSDKEKIDELILQIDEEEWHTSFERAKCKKLKSEITALKSKIDRDKENGLF